MNGRPEARADRAVTWAEEKLSGGAGGTWPLKAWNASLDTGQKWVFAKSMMKARLGILDDAQYWMV